MKHLLSILTLCLTLIGSAGAQCTISQVNMTNAQLVSGVAHFSLVFKHVRNSGNKWVTIHLWKDSDYPNYNYSDVPTTTHFGGNRPFGTIVINNSNVSSSGTYTAAQAFVSSYQNDGTFSVLNTIGSSLVYNSTTDTYVINDLQTVIPSGTQMVKFDSWSSQASGNQVVHCFSTGGQFLLPAVLAIKLNSFKAEVTDKIKFTWVTQWEKNNSHFAVQEQIGQDWVNCGTVFAVTDDGNSSVPTSYTLTIALIRKAISSAGFNRVMGIILLSFVVGLLVRRFVPARLIVIMTTTICLGSYSCTKSVEDGTTVKSTHWYRLVQFDKDGSSTTWEPIQVRY